MKTERSFYYEESDYRSFGSNHVPVPVRLPPVTDGAVQVQPSDTTPCEETPTTQSAEATLETQKATIELEDTTLTVDILPDEDGEGGLFLPSDDAVIGVDAMRSNTLYPRFKELLGFDPTVKELDHAFSGSDCVSVIFTDHQLIVPDYTLEIGDGSKLHLPMTYQELLDAGWNPDDEMNAEPPANSVPGEEYQWYSFINEQGKTLNAEIGNYSASPINLKDAVVTQLQAGGELTETYSVSGIQAGATVQEIMEQFGLPLQCSYYRWADGTESFDFYYIDDINYSHIAFNIDPETGLLDSISYCVLLHPDDRPA